MDSGQKNFAEEKEKIIKSIINDIKDHYFEFLSSLKFENAAEKKTQKDYGEQHQEEQNDVDHIHTVMNTISETHYNFEDELLI